MVWKGKTKMELRAEFVALANKPGANVSLLCRNFEITRRTGYKWLQRAKEGDRAFEDQSRRPKRSSNETPKALKELIIETRKKFPNWGGRKLHAWLVRKGHNNIPAPSTITKILGRNQLLDKTLSEQKAWVRFEHDRPNKLWQMDFKGHFAMTTGRCHPLTILDDHSRFSVCLEACANEQRATVQPKLELIFKRYGLPERINVDNGNPWGDSQGKAITRLEVWLIKLGVIMTHSRPNHPQTNGKDERFHRSLKTELINHRTFYDLEAAQKEFNYWRRIYNEERPHEALGMQVPIDRYQPSSREFPNIIPPIEYGLSDIVRKVQSRGYIGFKGRTIFIGESLIGEPVALRPTIVENIFDVYFCHQKICKIDIADSEF
jgi:transposase InsO family protein